LVAAAEFRSVARIAARLSPVRAGRAAMEIGTDPAKLHVLNSMKWWIRKWDRDAILIGDRPLLTYPRQQYPCGIPLDSPDCLVILPIAPNAVFFACANPKTQTKMRKMALSRLAKLVNEETIFRAICVHARDGSLAKFISPRLEGKMLGTWQPTLTGRRSCEVH
jgi:hypothetical protein